MVIFILIKGKGKGGQIAVAYGCIGAHTLYVENPPTSLKLLAQ